MKTIFLKMTLFSIFACCTIPVIASENQDQTEQITQQIQGESPEETTPQETQKLPDIQAAKYEYTKLLFAGCLFTSIALALTLRELAQTKTELGLYKTELGLYKPEHTLYKSEHAAQELIKLESNDLKAPQAETPFAQTISSLLAIYQATLKRIVATDYNSHLFNDFFLSNF